jgi:hypothetical protein
MEMLSVMRVAKHGSVLGNSVVCHYPHCVVCLQEAVRTTDALNVTEVPHRLSAADISDFTVSADFQYGRTWYVSGEAISRFASMTNWDYYEAALRFQKVLEAAGEPPFTLCWYGAPLQCGEAHLQEDHGHHDVVHFDLLAVGQSHSSRICEDCALDDDRHKQEAASSRRAGG